MPNRPSREGIARQHAKTLRGIRIWLADHPSTTPLELDVFDEIVERVAAEAQSGAFVRVRIKNQGSKARGVRPGGKARKPLLLPAVETVVGDERRARAENTPWTVEELDRLQTLFRQRYTLAEIAEAMERPLGSIVGKVSRLGIRRAPPKGKTGVLHRESATVAVAHRIAERRKEENRRASEEWAAD